MAFERASRAQAAVNNDLLALSERVCYRVNYVTLSVLMLGTVAAVFAAHFLHEFQMRKLSGIYLSRADEALANGDSAERFRQLGAYLAFRPEDVDVRVRLALEKADAARTPRAAYQALVDLERITKDLPGRGEARRKLIDLFLAFGRDREALQNLDVLIEAAPDDTDLRLLGGRIHQQVANREKAIEVFRSLIESRPNLTEAYEPLLELLRENSETDPEADEYYAQLLAKNPDSHSAYLIAARDAKRRGALTDALGCVRRAATLNPQDRETLFLASDLIWLQVQSGGGAAIPPADLETLCVSLRSILDGSPKLTAAYVALVQLEMIRGRNDVAREILEKGLGECHPRAPLQLCQIELLIESGEFAQADLLIAELEVDQKDRAACEFLRSRVEMAASKWTTAVSRLRALMKESRGNRPLEFQIEMALATCFERLHHTAMELAAYRDAVEIDRWSSAARLRLAQLLAAQGELDDAIFHYRFLASSHDVAIPLARLLLQVEMQRAVHDRSLQEVRGLLGQAEAAAGDASPALLELRVQLLMADENWVEAAEKARQAHERFPDDTALINLCLTMLLREGKRDAAKALVDEVESRRGPVPATLLLKLRLTVDAASQSGTAAPPRNQLAEQLEQISRSAGALPATQRAEVDMELALAAARMADHDLALRFWKESSEIAPDDLRTWRGMLDMAIRRADQETAQKCIAALRRLEGEEGVYWRLGMLALAIRAAEDGDRTQLVGADEILQSISRVLPGDVGVAILQARISELNGKFAEATELLQDAYEKGGHSLELAGEVVRRLYQRRRFSDAESFLTKHRLSEGHREMASLSRMSAEIALQIGEHDAAIQRARQAVDQQVANAEELLWLSRLLEESGAKAEAGTVLEAACTREPQNFLVWLARASWLLRQGSEIEARELIASNIDKVAESEQALLLAEWSDNLGDRDEAGRRYLVAVEARPDDRQVLIAAASYFLRIGDAVRSEGLWRRILSQADLPRDGAAMARRGLAASLLLRETYPQLIEGLGILDQNAIEMRQSAGEMRLRARILSHMPDRTRRRQAIAELQRVEELASLSIEDQNLLVHLFLSLGDWPSARRELAALCLRRPDDPQILSLGIREYLSHFEDLEGPEDWLRHLTDILPVDPITRELTIRLTAARDSETALAELREWIAEGGVLASDADTLEQELRIAGIAESIGTWLEDRNDLQAARLCLREAEQVLRRVSDRKDAGRLELARYLLRRGSFVEPRALLDQIEEAEVQGLAIGTVVELSVRAGATEDVVHWAQDWMGRRWSVRSESNSAVLFAAASLAQLKGDFDEAESFCRRILAQDAESPMACNDLAFLLAYRADQSDEARVLVERALGVAGPVSWLLDTKATIFRRAGDAEGAVAIFQQLVAEDGTPLREFHLALALDACRRVADARKALEKALQAGLSDSGMHLLERREFHELTERLLPDRSPAPNQDGSTRKGDSLSVNRAGGALGRGAN